MVEKKDAAGEVRMEATEKGRMDAAAPRGGSEAVSAQTASDSESRTGRAGERHGEAENLYTLLYPYTTPDGWEVKEISVRPRLTARDMREINRRTKKAEDYETSGVAVMCGMVEDDLLDMDAQDYLALRDRFFRCVGIAGDVSAG